MADLGPQIVQDFGGQPPVFNESGQLLGNLTSDFGQTPAPASPFTAANFDPASFAPSTVPAPIGGAAGVPNLSQAAAASGISGGGTPPSTTTGSVDAAVGSSVAQNWFARAVIVILGFVFVAVGLAQFGRGGIVQLVRGK